MRVRLQKLLAAGGIASRRKAEELLRAGRVTVNGRQASVGESADPDHDRIALDGEPVRSEKHAYWLLHKPKGVLSTRSDDEGRRTVVDLLPPRIAQGLRLFPVGRLDLESEGLLLLTNDGEVAHTLLHPSLGTEREYRVTVRGRLTESTARRLAKGVRLDDGMTAPARVEGLRYLAPTDRTQLDLVLGEGRKRQIRRSMRALGHPVVRLVRRRMGPLRLGSLAAGEVRPLTPAEVKALLHHVGERQAAGRSGAGARKPRAGRSRKPSSRRGKTGSRSSKPVS